ncbi:MAG: PQQ-binding-like beta-propeller repeat protein [Pseudomonadota bacterium]
MKKLNYFLLAGLILCLNACTTTKFALAPISEKHAPLVTSRTIQMDHTFSPSITLNATEYTFNCPLQTIRYGLPENQILMVGTDKKNKLEQRPVFIFNPGTGKIVWQIKTLTSNFNIAPVSGLSERVIVVGGSNEIFAVDIKNGQDVWKRSGNNITQGFAQNMAFSKHETDGVSQIEFFDTQNGKTVWNRSPFNCKWWGYKTHLLDENTLLLYGDGLHLFDLKTGKGWDYAVNTNAVGGVGKVVAGEILSVVAAMAGTVHVNTVRTDRLENLTSNSLIIKDKVYYAGNKIIVCVDLKTGKEVWEVDLPKRAGQTGLSEEDGHILVMGFGWCHKNGVTANYSKPFIARFNKEDGKQILYQELALDSYITSYLIRADGYFLTTTSQVIFVDKKDTSAVIQPHTLSKEKSELYSQIKNIVKNPQDAFVLKEDSNGKTYVNLTSLKTDESDIWVRTSNGIIHYNSRLEVQNWFSDAQLSLKFHEMGSAFLLQGFKQKCNDKKNDQCKQYEYIKIIDTADNGQLLGEIKTPLAVKIDGESLMLWDDTKLTDQITVLPLKHLNPFWQKEGIAK